MYKHCSTEHRGREIVLFQFDLTATGISFLVLIICTIALIAAVSSLIFRRPPPNVKLPKYRLSAKRLRRLSLTIVGINFAFLIFNLPVSVASLMQDLRFTYYYTIFDYLYYCQFVTNIFVHVGLNPKFRVQLIRDIHGL